MNQQSTHYAVLRVRRDWDPTLRRSGFRVDEDGVLSLAMFPGSVGGKAITLPGPFKVEPSGLAIGPCNDVVVSYTAKHQVIWQDGVCPEHTLVLGDRVGNAPGQFYNPGGLLVFSNSLYVADSTNSRVLIFRLPTLELRAIWTGIFAQPTSLTSDSKERIYVLDRGLNRILRFTRDGVADHDYNLSMARVTNRPAFIAVDGADTLYVSDARQDEVWRFALDGTLLRTLPLPNALYQPRALTARGDRLYIADADSGQIWAFDAGSDSFLGDLPGYRGPVSAMAIGPDDSLWIKPGDDHVKYRLEPQQRFVTEGMLTTSEVLDAGEDTDWARVHVEAAVPEGTSVQLKLITGQSKPSESQWSETLPLPLDTLVPPLPDAHPTAAGDKRFLWIRVIAATDNQQVTPRIFQVEAETASPSYLDYLPAVYRRAEGLTRFLERWLKLIQGDVDDWEAMLEAMPRRFDPLTTPEEQLSWLAKWLAFPLPTEYATDKLRALFAEIPKFYELRGTPDGICDLAELYTGQRPLVFEAFHTRRVWQLGVTSLLGLETMLPPALPDGIIVPGWTVADPELMGLRGDYYEGINFDKLRATRNDAQINFDWSTGSPLPNVLEADNFSIRWTGQVQPRHSDLYTFHTITDDGVRLWIDGRLIIDDWVDHAATERQGRIALTEGRWYSITLEYYEKSGVASVQLLWSSRKQMKEIIPSERLYAVRDEHANLGGPAATAGDCPVLVGQTVVGQSQPLAADEYGAPLYNESAHLFTVSVPAASLPTVAQREMLRTVIEREKPAHTDYHLCFVEARMRVGFQARIGIDSVVAGPPEPLSLEGSILGVESYLGDDETQGRIGRVGVHGHIGQDTILG